MRFNKNNLFSWYIFSRSALNVIAASILVKLGLIKTVKNQVTLFSHQYNGNIKALHKHLLKEGLGPALWATSYKGEETNPQQFTFRQLHTYSFIDALLICRSECIVSDHGPGVLSYMLKLRLKCKFVDVWHGIGFKDVSESYANIHQHYDLLLSPSTWYTEHFLKGLCGFDQEKIQETGYCLLDELTNPKLEGLPKTISQFDKFILFAPTWHHDNAKRQKDCHEPGEVLKALSEVARKNNAAIIYRAHLNDTANAEIYPNTFSLPMKEYPDTVALLKLSDCLVSDWSSIAIDFLCLEKPIYHLNSEPAFGNSFLLQASERPGYICNSIDDMAKKIEHYFHNGPEPLSRTAQVTLEKTHAQHLDQQCCNRAQLAISDLIRN